MFPGPSKTSYNSSSAFRFSDKGTKETEDRAQKWNMWSSTIQVYVQRTRRTIQGNKQSCEFSIFLGPGKTCWGRGVIRNLSWNWVPEEMAAAKKQFEEQWLERKKIFEGEDSVILLESTVFLRWFLIAMMWTEHIDLFREALQKTGVNIKPIFLAIERPSKCRFSPFLKWNF